MSDFEQLKPCPFYGGGASEGSVGSSVPGSDDDGYLYIECPQCNGAYGKPFIGVHGDDKDVLRGIWNTRSAKQSMQGEAVGEICYMTINGNSELGGIKWVGNKFNYSIGTKLYTNTPDSAARIAEQDAEIAKLKMAIEYDNADDDAAFEPPHPIFQLAQERDNFMFRVKELEQQLEVARKVPDGYKIVPIEPTQEMLEAAMKLPAMRIKSSYAAMLSAAPDAAIRQIGGAE